MNVHEVRLRPRSPFREPPRAPGLFGHLAWAKRYRDGEPALVDWLEQFRAEPPLRISSAFPSGYLPVPELPAPAVTDTHLRKALKAVRYVDTNLFTRIGRQGLTALVDHLRTRQEQNDRAVLASGWLPSERTRVAIDRSTGGALEGALFSEDTLWFASELDSLSIYLKGTDAAVAEALELLDVIGRTGYGGGSSIGLGAFDLLEHRTATLPAAPNPTHAVTLAPVLPHAGMNGWWRIETYWGRLGGHFASHAKPFKRPHLRVLEGATLDLDTSGGLLDTTPDPPPDAGVRIWEYLYAFPLPVQVQA